MGASMPVYAILFGEVLGILSKSIPEAREESVFYSAMFLVVGVGKNHITYRYIDSSCHNFDICFPP